MRNRKNILRVAGIALLAGIVGVWLFSKGQDTPATQQTSGTLGQHECLSKFSVEPNDAPTESLTGAERLGHFQSFASGAFSGKIEDYHPSTATSFSSLINELMKNGEIRTYEQLSAEVCLYGEDLLNPEDGATLDYFVEHRYCTNECQTGTYSIRVDLNSEGHFVGYREDFRW